MLQYSILQGLKPAVRAHVFQADAKTIPEILHAARVADVVVPTTAEPSLTNLLSELRNSNAKYDSYQQQLDNLNSRMNQLHVSAVNRSSGRQPRRVRFDLRTSSSSGYHTNSNPCNRCGRPLTAFDKSERCYAKRLECFQCHKVGHVRGVLSIWPLQFTVPVPYLATNVEYT